MKISAAKMGLHRRDVTQSLCEKGQQFKQEIRHHNPIKSEGYHRAPAFSSWSLTTRFDPDVCSCTPDVLSNTVLTFSSQIWIIKPFSQPNWRSAENCWVCSSCLSSLLLQTFDVRNKLDHWEFQLFFFSKALKTNCQRNSFYPPPIPVRAGLHGAHRDYGVGSWLIAVVSSVSWCQKSPAQVSSMNMKL